MIRVLTIVFLVMSLMLSGCGRSPETARKELGQMNIQYNEQSFLKTIESNDSIAVKLFMEAGMDPNVNVDGGTPLMVAAAKNRVEIAKNLIEKKANVNAKDKEGSTPLIFAIVGDPKGSASTEAVKLLLDNNADVNIHRTHDGFTPLMAAVAKNDLTIVKLLLAKGADVNAKSKDGITALIVAAASDNKGSVITDIAKLLLEKGADVNAKPEQGMSALTAAKKSNKQDLINILLAAGAKEEAIVASKSSLLGRWSVNSTARNMKNIINMTVKASDEESNQISITLFMIGPSSGTHAKMETQTSLTEQNAGSFSFTDSRGNSGSGSLRIEGEKVKLIIKSNVTENNIWGIFPGEYFLYKGGSYF